MSNTPAFYQTLFQYDTLFRVEEELSALQVPAAPKEAPAAISPPAVQIDNSPVDAPRVDAPRVDTPGVGAPGVDTPGVDTPPVIAQQSPPATPPPAVPFPALRHRVLVLVDEPKQPELIASEAILLDKILKAVGHSADEADIINLSYLPTADARSVLAGKLTNHFITFGVPLIKLQLDLLLPPYTPKQVEGIWFLLADPLVVIEEDKNLKKRLWLALQKMFAVS